MAAQRGWAASASRSARSAASKPWAWLGWRPSAAWTCGKSPAATRALRLVAASIPTVRIRVTPSRAAAATSSLLGGAHESRCVWLSITARGRRSGLGEQRLERAHRSDRPCARACALEADVRSVQRGEELLGGSRDPRDEQHGDHAQALDQRAQDAVEVRGARRVLGQLPRRLLLHVAVQPPDPLPDLVQRLGQLDAIDEIGYAV